MNPTAATQVKLFPIVFAGNRYVVQADFGLEQPVPLMVHGNASFYLMLTHAIASQLNGGQPVAKLREYGYSDKGLGSLKVAKFQLGERVFTGVENVRVFDWPAEAGQAAQGMLGLDFLKRERVRIDFVSETLEIGAPLQPEPDPDRMAQGYAYTEFFIENHKAYLNLSFDALEKELPITVGTVAESYSLDAVTFRDKIALARTELQDHSPNGTTPQIYHNAVPVKFRLAGQTFEIPTGQAEFHSFAEYQQVPQAELFPFGILGRDWMKANHVLLDYANQRLYFKNKLPSPTPAHRGHLHDATHPGRNSQTA